MKEPMAIFLKSIVINFWFANRKAGVATTAIATPFGALFGLPFFKTAFKKPANPNMYAAILPFSFGVLFGIFSLVSFVGLLKILRFSKKKLYMQLLQYQSGQGLHGQIQEKLERFMRRKH